MDLSTAEKVTFIVARGVGLLSFLSAVCVVQEAVADWRHRKTNTIVTRVQALMQIPTILHSIVNMLGTSVAPSDQGIWLASGTITTCTFQGFLLQFSLNCGICHDMLLSLSYLFTVKYGWNEQQLRSMERIGQCFIWPYAVAMSVYPLVRNLYGHVHEVCFIRSTTDCDGPEHDDYCVPTPAIATWLRLWLFCQNIFHVTLSFYVIAQIYYVALSEPESVTRLVAVKGIFYAASVAVLQLPFCIWGLWFLIVGQNVQVLQLLVIMLLPLAGFLNMLVFMLNRRELRTAYGTRVRQTIDCVATTFCCCLRGGFSEASELSSDSKELSQTEI